MTLSSMTGFARTEGQWNSPSEKENCSWVWEIRSVNGRGLDVRCRVPSGLDAFDQYIKTTCKKMISRGSLNINLQLQQEQQNLAVKVNQSVLEQLVESAVDTSVKFNLPQPTIASFYGLRDVVEVTGGILDAETLKSRDEALKKSFLDAVEALKSARLEEGQATFEMLTAHLDEIESLLKKGEEIAAQQPDLLKKKFTDKVNALLSDDNKLDMDRVTQEIVILATKADVKEETDRLHAHIVSARKLITANGPVGRKLDFLTQEFNREANTLCSKSPTAELTEIGLSLKTVIDQFREQIQNIE